MTLLEKKKIQWLRKANFFFFRKDSGVGQREKEGRFGVFEGARGRLLVTRSGRLLGSAPTWWGLRGEMVGDGGRWD